MRFALLVKRRNQYGKARRQRNYAMEQNDGVGAQQ